MENDFMSSTVEKMPEESPDSKPSLKGLKLFAGTVVPSNNVPAASTVTPKSSNGGGNLSALRMLQKSGTSLAPIQEEQNDEQWPSTGLPPNSGKTSRSQDPSSDKSLKRSEEFSGEDI